MNYFEKYMLDLQEMRAQAEKNVTTNKSLMQI